MRKKRRATDPPLKATMTGREMREIRTNEGLRQADLAKWLGVTRAAVTRWETGSLPISRRTALAVRGIAAHAGEVRQQLLEATDLKDFG